MVELDITLGKDCKYSECCGMQPTSIEYYENLSRCSVRWMCKKCGKISSYGKVKKIKMRIDKNG